MAISVFLAHGASGSVETIRPHVDGLRRRGLDAHAVALPRRRAEDAVDAYLAAAPPAADVVVGGHSYGGRVAGLAVAGGAAYRALVLLSYPLHRPGTAEWESRVAHWPRIPCPVLLLSGESDPFARVELLRRAVKLLPSAELVTYPGLRHGLGAALDDALDRVSAFVGTLPTG